MHGHPEYRFDVREHRDWFMKQLIGPRSVKIFKVMAITSSDEEPLVANSWLTVGKKHCRDPEPTVHFVEDLGGKKKKGPVQYRIRDFVQKATLSSASHGTGFAVTLKFFDGGKHPKPFQESKSAKHLYPDGLSPLGTPSRWSGLKFEFVTEKGRQSHGLLAASSSFAC